MRIVTVTHIENDSLNKKNPDFHFLDENRIEYYLLNCPMLENGAKIRLLIDDNIILEPKPLEPMEPIEYKRYLNQRRFGSWEITNKEELSEDLQKILYLYEETKLIFQDILLFKKLTSLKTANFLLDKLDNDPFWYCNFVSFARIDKYIDKHTFLLRKREMFYCLRESLMDIANCGNTWTAINKLLQTMNNKFAKPDRRTTKEEIKAYLNNYSNYFYFDGKHIAIKSYYDKELSIYNKIKILNQHSQNIYVDNIIDRLCDEQNDAVAKTLSGPDISILTGGPGTGKTTTICEILKLYMDRFPRNKIQLLAPTGRAVKRMCEAIYEELGLNLINTKEDEEFDEYDDESYIDAKTIHKYLGYGSNPKNKKAQRERIKETSFIIIDESSMIDVNLFYELLSYINEEKVKILLVGDENQLPSIGAGNILRDLIDLGIQTSYLKINHRSLQTIDKNAKKILKGKTDLIIDESFTLITEDVSNTLASDLFLSNSVNAILSPYRKDLFKCSTSNINNMIHQRLYGETTRFEVGDIVICNRTNYKIGIFNGEIGTVRAVSIAYIDIDLGDRTVRVEDTDDIDFAYAITIHKSQGSEYPNILIMIDDNETSDFLTKNMLYTALTRAKRHVYLKCSYKMLEKIAKTKTIRRKTFLSMCKKINNK